MTAAEYRAEEGPDCGGDAVLVVAMQKKMMQMMLL